MNIEKLTKLIEKCESLEETLEMAHDEALAIQKETGAENLDVMHIGQAQEVVAMRIGYLNRQKEKLEIEAKENAEKKAAEEEAKAKADADAKAKETGTGGAQQQQ